MKQLLNEEPQSIVIYKINPNEQELGGEVPFDKNVNGRIFGNCRFYIADHAIIIEKSDGEIVGIFSLHHYYFLNQR